VSKIAKESQVANIMKSSFAFMLLLSFHSLYALKKEESRDGKRKNEEVE